MVVEAWEEAAVGVTGEDLRSAFVHAPTGIAVLTPTGVVTGGNPALASIVGRELTELMGTTLFTITHPEDLPTAVANCTAMAAGEVTVVREQCRFLRPDTTAVWVRVSTCRVEAQGDRAAHLIMHVEDISEQKALEARLVHQALHDPLTGLGNRALLHHQVTIDLSPTAAHPTDLAPTDLAPADLAGALGAARPGRGGGLRVCGLVLFDLDGFKALNDAFGHPAGDAALVEVAHRAQALLGPEEVAVRVGGDEFAVWCPNTTPTQVADLVEQLRTAISAPCLVEGAVVELAVSIGSATQTVPTTPGGDESQGDTRGNPLAGLLRAADKAMYTDKRRTRT